MAALVVITHEYDPFLVTEGSSSAVRSPYLLFGVLEHLLALGHTCRIVRGPRAAPGDAALLHVDSTIVSDEYLRLAANYSLCINFRTGDITKRAVSRLLLSHHDNWDGRVIVKSNYNNNAFMEEFHNGRAQSLGRPPPHPRAVSIGGYQVLNSLAEVSDAVWSDPTVVVEKFIPEVDPAGGFVLRTWVFMGRRERCTRMVTSDEISKAGDVIRYEMIEVPAQLRAQRDRLGFDFGKFDFVMYDGEPILLDANRTPGVAQAVMPLIRKGAFDLAEGLHEMLGT